jgi:SOS-response transcriptional repressor LexA
MKKYTQFAKVFRSALEQRDWTLKLFSENSGIKLATIGNYSRGANVPDGKNREKVQRLLGLRDEDFAPDSPSQLNAQPNARFADLGVEGYRRVPVISMARAGNATDYEDMMNFIEDYTVTKTKDENAFALIVEGDSMEKAYVAGDLIICSPRAMPRNGKPVVARIRDDDIPNTGGVLFKRFYSTGPSGQKVRLESDNPNYPPIERDQSDFWFIYPVVTTVRNERYI